MQSLTVFKDETYHHLIPRNLLNEVLTHRCMNVKYSNGPLCIRLLADVSGVPGVPGDEFCGGAWIDKHVQQKAFETNKIRSVFYWETGNLFYGPGGTHRTDDPGSGFEDGFVDWMNCIHPGAGTQLVNAKNALLNYKKLNLKDKQDCQQEAKDRVLSTKCDTTIGILNTFFKSYCTLKDNALYPASFYEQFWDYDKNTGKYSLKQFPGSCDGLTPPSPDDILNSGTTLVRFTSFLEGEAVVSNHFHKTKTADASSFILDDSVDARF